MTQVTTPLAKAITTLEGQLVIVSDVVVAGAAAIDPSALPPKWAAIVVGVQHVALLIQRGLIKVKASPVVAAIVDSPKPLVAVEQFITDAINQPEAVEAVADAQISALSPNPS